ncbi:DNA repair protein rad16 [Boothiomyces macroporosus]|uniref:DNA repair protein rad16 n=1 Tax=Boothiomyces macroporosus TaxID=261099 RepID=A0AAD5UDF9_9FUNG|nr:DNA repair protein rad16 [Boothiomyces macroporosus]
MNLRNRKKRAPVESDQGSESEYQESEIDSLSEFEDEEEEPIQKKPRMSTSRHSVPLSERNSDASAELITEIFGNSDDSIDQLNQQAIIEILDTEEENPPKKKGKKEKKVKLTMKEIHPDLENVWKDLEQEPKHVPNSSILAKNMTVSLLPFQKEGLAWMKEQEKSKFRGGILADEMGMGKTIQMVSLIVSEFSDRPTLILCPTVAIVQWNNELLTRTVPGLLKVLIYHGPKRVKDVKELKKYDIILSTYAILEQGYRKQQYGTKKKGVLVKEASPLHQIHWGRLILDEAVILTHCSMRLKIEAALLREQPLH